MEIKRMPRSQFLKLTMENNKKRIQRVKAAPRKLIIKKYINEIKSSQSAFFLKLPRKNIKHKQTRDCLIEIV